jgi:hypothetical protein
MCNLQLGNLIYMHAAQTLPTLIMDIFTRNVNVHDHNTMHRLYPHVRNSNLELTIQIYLYKAPEMWYQLPHNIK